MKKVYIFLIFFSIVILPPILNFILLLPSPIPENWQLGEPKDWLSFWAVYFGAAATSIMAFITFRTIKQNDKLIIQNEEQLNELKKQWTDLNRPKISCTLVIRRHSLIIEIKNTSPSAAHNVKVTLSNHTTETILSFAKLNNLLKDMVFEISPYGVKEIPINGISIFKEGKYDGFITAKILYNGKEESFNLYLKEINTTVWQYGTNDLFESLNNINSSIQNYKIK